jgi:hypothetical protein
MSLKTIKSSSKSYQFTPSGLKLLNSIQRRNLTDSAPDTHFLGSKRTTPNIHSTIKIKKTDDLI